MCAIEEVRSYRYAGKHYDTELEAVTAALTEIGTRIIRDHHHNPVEGLLKYGNDIGELRARYGTLSLPGNAVEVTSETLKRGPKGQIFTVWREWHGGRVNEAKSLRQVQVNAENWIRVSPKREFIARTAWGSGWVDRLGLADKNSLYDLAQVFWRRQSEWMEQAA